MRALIAMSGGVDSSMAAYIMSNDYECIGCTMKLHTSDGLIDTSKDAEDASNVTNLLGIPFHILHYENLFRDNVIEPFVCCYENGATPNPCITCNKRLKFGELFNKMKELNCDYLVTGHYARITYDDVSERYLLRKALDESKDQSYMLYNMTQEHLKHVKFPLGELTKSDVRKNAEKHGLINADKPDSQDICFIPDGNYVKFISDYRGKNHSKGHFVTKDGRVLGEHNGYINYTIGQRRGIGISVGHPLYVVDIDPKNNIVVLGENEDLFSSTLTARNINLISVPEIKGEMRVKARIRYHHNEQPATVTQVDNDTIRVVFDEPQRAITRGQAVVLYDGDIVVGGGTII